MPKSVPLTHETVQPGHFRWGLPVTEDSVPRKVTEVVSGEHIRTEKLDGRYGSKTAWAVASRYAYTRTNKRPSA